jgi:hypothetical protein
MNNIIDEWQWQQPTKEGDYLCCYGDVETPENVHFIRLRFDVTGTLVDRESNSIPVTCYGKTYKFARLVYRQSEINEIT